MQPTTLAGANCPLSETDPHPNGLNKQSVGAPLRVLIIEDSEDDTELLLTRLRRGGYSPAWERVDTPAAMRAALERSGWDLVLSDHTLPCFSAPAALAVLQEYKLDLPFIIVSGRISEAVAITAMRAGAHDYVLKADLARLIPAIERELREAAVRRERRQAEATLCESQQNYEALVNSVDGIVWEADAHTLKFSFVSRQAERLLGYPVERWITEPSFWADHVYADDRAWAVDFCVTAAAERRPHEFEYRMVAADGRLVWLRDIVTVTVEADQRVTLRGIMLDVTAQKRAEARLRLSDEILQRVASLILVADEQGQIIYASPSANTVLGYEPPDLLGEGWWQISGLDPEERELKKGRLARLARGELTLDDAPYEKQVKHRTGAPRWMLWQDARGPDGLIIGVGHDITERKQRELEREVIVTVAAALRTAQTRAEMLPVLLDQVLGLLKADSAWLMTRDPITGEAWTELVRGVAASLTGHRLLPGVGLTGHVIATGQPYLNNAVETDPRRAWPKDFAEPQALAGVPLIAQGQAIGVLWAARQNAISADELRLLTAIGDIAANALHRAALHEQTGQRLRRLGALHSIDRVITANLDLRAILSVFLDEALLHLGVDAAAVSLLGPHTRRLEYIAECGFRHPARERSGARVGEGPAGRAALERRRIHVPNLPKAEELFVPAHRVGGEDFIAYYAVPLIAKGQVNGVLEVFQRAPLTPDPEWLDFLETLAGQAAIAIDNATLFENL